MWLLTVESKDTRKTCGSRCRWVHGRITKPKCHLTCADDQCFDLFSCTTHAFKFGSTKWPALEHGQHFEKLGWLQGTHKLVTNTITEHSQCLFIQVDCLFEISRFFCGYQKSSGSELSRIWAHWKSHAFNWCLSFILWTCTNWMPMDCKKEGKCHEQQTSGAPLGHSCVNVELGSVCSTYSAQRHSTDKTQYKDLGICWVSTCNEWAKLFFE